MKDQTKQTAHRLAAVLSLALALVVGGALADTVVWSGDKGNGSMSDGGNWYGGAAPAAGDTLDFGNANIETALNADFTDGREFATLIVGTGNLTLSEGTLKLATVTNAYTLGVASGATLAISGDLVGYAARNTKPLLRSNEGTVTVGGLVRFRSSGATKGESIVSQYASANDNSSPIIANGLAYHADSWSDYLVANLGSMDNGPGKWVIGKDGTSYPSSRQIGHSGFRITGQDVTLGSSADWTFAETYRHTGNDLYIRNAGKVTVDTSDYYDNAIPRTVTFVGFINEESSLATAFVVKGCGTLVLNTAVQSGKDNVVKNELAVTETATLQINKGKSITGSGTVSLASGTKLLVPDASATVGLPSLAPAAGSTIVVTNLTAGTPAIALTGSLTMPAEGQVALKIGGATQLEDGIYTVLSAANALPEDAVEHFTLDASEVVSDECSLYTKGGVLLLLVGIAEPGYGIWVGGTDAKLSTAANWLNGETPRAGDTLNFKTVGAATTINADFEDNRVFTTAVFGSGVVTLTGNLDVNTLTNASKLAVASGATLTVEKDLVAMPTEENGKCGIFLGSNEGTVKVKGLARGYSTLRGSNVYQYDTVIENTQPICAEGLAYDGGGDAQLYWHLFSKGNTPGKWVVGSRGFSWPNRRNANYSMFYVEGADAPVTLYSSANWQLDNSNRYNTLNGDLWVNGSSLTIDTSDYYDSTIPRTVTLEGRIRTTSKADSDAVIVTGCGTVVVATDRSRDELSEDQKWCSITNGTSIAVRDTATLKVNAGKKILGEGTISLAAGTTLALPANVDRTFTTREIIPVMLPEEGKATLKIDAEHSLRIGEYVLLNSVPAGYAEHLAVEGTALSGRKASLKDDGENLILDVKSAGVMLVFR